MYVRIRLPIGEPHPALLIIDRAIQSDQGLKYVYVIDAQNKVQYRRVKPGPLQEDGLRVVTGDIKPDDWVIVGATSTSPRTHGGQAGAKTHALACRAGTGGANVPTPLGRSDHSRPYEGRGWAGWEGRIQPVPAIQE